MSHHSPACPPHPTLEISDPLNKVLSRATAAWATAPVQLYPRAPVGVERDKSCVTILVENKPFGSESRGWLCVPPGLRPPAHTHTLGPILLPA